MKEKYLLRIGGVVLLALLFGVLVGRFLPIPSIVTVGLSSGLYWFMQYDEQAYKQQEQKFKRTGAK